MKTKLQNRGKIELGEIAKIISGFAFKSELFNDQKIGIPLIRIRNLERGGSDTYYSGKYEKDYVVEKGDLLISMDGEFKINQWQSKPAVLNQRVCKLIIDEKFAIPKYVFYIISKKLKEIEDKTPFVTVKHISSKQILSIELLLPSVAIQQQIVSILEKADKLKKMREEGDKLTKDFLKAVFFNMFNDYLNSSSSWEELEKACVNISVGIVIEPSKYYVKDGIPALRSQNVKPNEIVLNNLVYVSKKDNEGVIAKSKVYTGDLVVVRSGYPGTTAVIPKSLNGINCIDLIIIRPNHSKINSTYMSFLLNSTIFMQQIKSGNRGVAQQHFNIGSIRKLKIPIPEVSLQKQFSDIVKEIDKVKDYQKQSKEHISNLFDNVMQKVDKGELAC